MLDNKNSEEVLEIGKRYLEAMADAIRSNIDSTGRTASGRSARSVKVIMTPSGGRIVGRQYFQGLEIGRDKGRVPYKFHKIIRQWMHDKGIENSFTNPAGASWLIARKIEREGTLLWKNHRYDVYTPAIDRLGGELELELITRTKRNLSAEIKKQFGNG